MTGLTPDVMGDDSLHILAVTVDGREGLYRGYVDGVPALVASFLSSTTPAIGVAQLGGSSTSRSRRFHGLVAEVIHYDKTLTTRQMHAIGHYLQHKYKIDGAYTDERTALAAAAGGGNASADGVAALAGVGAEAGAGGETGKPLAQLQLMLPPASGCLTHRGALKSVELSPCDEAHAEQRWEWNAAALELRWGRDGSQCLTYLEDEGTFGVWPCEFTESEFEYQPLAHRFCLSASPARCVAQLIATVPMLLRAANPDGSIDADSALDSAKRPLCLQFVKPSAELKPMPCREDESAQRFEYDALSAE